MSSLSSIHNTGGTGSAVDYELIAQAVATLLKPMIHEAVESALQEDLQQISKDMAACEKCLGEVEQRVSTNRESIKSMTWKKASGEIILGL